MEEPILQNIKLNKEQIRKLLQSQALSFGTSTFLLVDGIPITLQLKYNGKNPLQRIISVYIAGQIKGSWFAVSIGDNSTFNETIEPIVSKVWAKKTSRCMNKKDYNSCRRAFGKKKADERWKKSLMIMYGPRFTNLNTLAALLNKAEEVKYLDHREFEEMIKGVKDRFKAAHPEMFKE